MGAATTSSTQTTKPSGTSTSRRTGFGGSLLMGSSGRHDRQKRHCGRTVGQHGPGLRAHCPDPRDSLDPWDPPDRSMEVDSTQSRYALAASYAWAIRRAALEKLR